MRIRLTPHGLFVWWRYSTERLRYARGLKIRPASQPLLFGERYDKRSTVYRFCGLHIITVRQ